MSPVPDHDKLNYKKGSEPTEYYEEEDDVEHTITRRNFRHQNTEDHHPSTPASSAPSSSESRNLDHSPHIHQTGLLPGASMPLDVIMSISPLQPLSTIPGPVRAIMSSLVTTNYADLVIICGDRRWKCHQVVVCPQSDVLESLRKPDEPPNRHRSTIHLPNTTPSAIDKLMGYLYTGSFLPDASPPSYGIHSLVDIYILGQTLHLPGLTTLARTYYARQLSHIESLPELLISIKTIYTDTSSEDRGLRDVVVEAVVGELRDMWEQPHVRERLMEFINECREFWGDIVGALATAFEERRPPVVCLECGVNEDGYDVEVSCRICGNTGRVALN